MASNQELKVILSGDSTGLSAELTKATGAVQDAASKMQGSFDTLTSKLGSFQGALVAMGAALAGGSVFKGAIDGTVEMGKEVGKLSRVMGISAESASALRVAIGDVHGDTDGYLGVVAKLTKAISGNGDKFEQYGITIKDSNGNLLDYQTIMENTSNRLQDFTEGASRNSVATQLFGKGWVEAGKYLKNTSDVMDEARDKVDRLGLVFGPERQQMVARYRAEMNNFNDVVESAKLKVGDRLMPELIRVGAWFSKTGPEAISKIFSVFDSLIKAFDYTTVKIIALGAAIGLAANAGLFGALTKVIAPMQNFIQMIRVQMALGAMQGVTGIQGFGAALATTLGPAGMIAIAIAGIAGLLIFLEKLSRKFEENQETFRTEMQKTVTTMDKAKGYFEALAKVQDQIKNGKLNEKGLANAKTREERQLDALKALGPEVSKYTALIGTAYKDANEAYSAYLEGQRAGFKWQRDEYEKQIQAKQIQLQEAEEGLKNAFTEEGVNYYNGLFAKLTKEIGFLQKTRDEAAKSSVAGTDIEAPTGDGGGAGKGDPEKESKALERSVERKKEILIAFARSQGQILLDTGQQEAEFYREGLKTFKLNQEQRAEFLSKIHKLEEQDRQKNFLNAKEAELASFESDIKAAENNFDQQIRLSKARELYIEQTYVGDKKRLEDAHKQTVELEKKKDEQILKMKMDALQKEQALEKANLTFKEQKLNQLRDSREITEADFLKTKLKYSLEELDLEKKMLDANLALIQQDPSKALEVQQLKEQIELLQKKRDLIADQGNYEIKKQENSEDPVQGMKEGINDWVDSLRNRAGEVRSIFSSIGSGITSSLSNAFQTMMTQGRGFSAGMTALWNGLKNTVIKAIADMLAKELAAWAVRKVMSAWNTADTAKSTAENTTKTTGNTIEATSGIFKAHSGIPFVGIAIAIGMIALMMAAMSSAKSSASGRARGGIAGINGPELTWLGDGGKPELVVPPNDFKDWTEEFSVRGADIAAQTHASKYASANLASMASQFMQDQPKGPQGHQITITGNTMLTSESETASQLALLIDQAGTSLGRRNRI